VYRARDTRLGRDVAIKSSAERFSERFEREAKVIASLNHPNICHLYDVGPNYLVMELIEGPTLAARINEGALPLEEALPIARQMAEALEAAHEKGITHRDLKPGNVKVKADGTVKVLDFGLAKVGGTPTVQSDASPTVTLEQTEAGVILGTAAYMSPEQAKGKPVDQRADVYAFGAVLYEMVTGTRLHHGETTTEALASVIKEEPQWDKVPAPVRRLLRRCLEKDPQKRQRHIGDVMGLVEEEGPAAQAAPASASGREGTPPRLGKSVWITAAAAVVIMAGAVAWWAPWRARPNVLPVRFQVGPAEKMTFTNGGAMTISPDGHWMVFPANGEDGVTRYWIRSLDTVDVRALPGTEQSSLAPPVGWSWDSHYVVFGLNRKLQKIDIQGGPPQALADVPTGLNGAAWNRDGVIVFGLAPAGPSPLFRVLAAGGTAAPVTALAKGESGHRFPQFLPDGRHFLYLRVSPDPNRTGIYAGSIDAKPEEQSLKRLLATNREAYYAASPAGGPGRLVFLRDTTLMAQPFDPGKMELSGEPVPIAEGVDSFPGANYGLFSVSDTGALVYREGSGSRTQLTWFDENGNATGTIGEPGDYANPAISPDGSHVAVALGPSANRDIWILDISRGTSTRFTFDPACDYPVWSPDGKNIVFASYRAGHPDLYIKPTDGSAEERVLLKSDDIKVPTGWSRDGRFLLFMAVSPKTRNDIWALPMQGQQKPLPVLQTQFNETGGTFSPDGRWIAYTSNESGALEVYVRPFSPDGGTGAKWLVSKGVAGYPRWRADGKRLFYITLNSQLMAVEIDTGKGFQAGTPRRLFAVPGAQLATNWDLAPDGKRFLFDTTPNPSRPAPFTVVLNWAAGLKK
jgi:Tol biopolymer transport system component/predicted Ser/Thr protein kinase